MNKVLQVLETQPLQNYLDRRQATVAEWVSLRSFFDLCVSKTGYDVGEKLWVPW